MSNGKSDHSLLIDTRDRVMKLEVKVDDIHSAIINKKQDRRFWEAQSFQIIGSSSVITGFVVWFLKLIGWIH